MEKPNGLQLSLSCIWLRRSGLYEFTISKNNLSMAVTSVVYHLMYCYERNIEGVQNGMLQRFKKINETKCLFISNARLRAVDINLILSDFLSLTKGVPQGSILGPLLFWLSKNDLPQTTCSLIFIQMMHSSTSYSLLLIRVLLSIKLFQIYRQFVIGHWQISCNSMWLRRKLLFLELTIRMVYRL